MTSNVEGAKKSLQQDKKVEDAHKEDIQELESGLRNIELNKEEFDETTKEGNQSQSDSTVVIPADDRIEMYQLDTINREHSKLDSEKGKKLDVESKLKKQGHKPEEGKKMLDKLNDHFRPSKTKLKELQKQVPPPNYQCIIVRHCQDRDIEGHSKVLKMMLDQCIKINDQCVQIHDSLPQQGRGTWGL